MPVPPAILPETHCDRAFGKGILGSVVIWKPSKYFSILGPHSRGVESFSAGFRRPTL